MADKKATKKVEKKATAKTTKKETKKVSRSFTPGQTYNFKSNGIAPSLVKGMVYKVSALQAEVFTKNGYGEIID
jgi:hypothetical protein